MPQSLFWAFGNIRTLARGRALCQRVVLVWINKKIHGCLLNWKGICEQRNRAKSLGQTMLARILKFDLYNGFLRVKADVMELERNKLLRMK